MTDVKKVVLFILAWLLLLGGIGAAWYKGCQWSSQSITILKKAMMPQPLQNKHERMK